LPFAQGSFALGRFFGQNMAGAGFFIDNFSSARFSTSLCGGPLCFYLWHINFSFMLNCSTRIER
jgi:hypothetical protein